MSIDDAEPIIKVLLGEIVIKLQEAEQVAKAAFACADAGSIPEAIRVSMDLARISHSVEAHRGANQRKFFC